MQNSSFSNIIWVMITSRDEMLHIAFYTYNVLLPRTYCIKFVFQFNLRTCTNHMQKIQKAKYLVRNTANIINNYYHILFSILKRHVTSVSLYLKCRITCTVHLADGAEQFIIITMCKGINVTACQWCGFKPR
jgi:hypothetical protein